jgi:Sugar-binding N-terminal domain
MKSIPTRYPRLDYDSVLSSLLPSRDVSHSLWRQKNRTLVVLDDDPTGTQTVHDITVITTFDKKTLKAQLATNEKGFFILTNSRAYHDAEVGTTGA